MGHGRCSAAPKSEEYPTIKFKPRQHKRVCDGHPWAFSNEVEMSRDAKALPPGTLVLLCDTNGNGIGIAMFNPRSLICARILSRAISVTIDTSWISARLIAALQLRNRMFPAPYYRLVHAEADGLPGLIIDRFDETTVVQLNTAGMELLCRNIIEALNNTILPKTILIQRQGSARILEGLDAIPTEIIGNFSNPTRLEENGNTFLIDLLDGQKTGWFFDHRENRSRAAILSRGHRVADIYSYVGGFGLQGAVAGASEVLCVDRSKPALALASQAAEISKIESRCRFLKSDAFTALEDLNTHKERFGVVIADPPAFVKTKKNLKSGRRGYRKLAGLAARIVEQNGILCIASCSHHVDVKMFTEDVNKGVVDARRNAIVLHVGGAAPDHPVHPALPESSYLKCLFLKLD